MGRRRVGIALSFGFILVSAMREVQALLLSGYAPIANNGKNCFVLEDWVDTLMIIRVLSAQE